MQKDAESTSSDSEGLESSFMGVVTSVTDGDLTFPAPYDLATSAALASNIDTGGLAEKLFDVTADRDCRYEVTVTALSPVGAEPPMRREIINTVAQSTQAMIALLDGLLDEIEARLDAEQNPR